MQPKYFYLLYIGGHVDDIAKKSIRFVLETEREGYIGNPSRYMKGRVVARERNAVHHINSDGRQWVNPVIETAEGFFPNFVRVTREHVIKNFPDNTMNEEPGNENS
jgi:hypothetical protein